MKEFIDGYEYILCWKFLGDNIPLSFPHNSIKVRMWLQQAYVTDTTYHIETVGLYKLHFQSKIIYHCS